MLDAPRRETFVLAAAIVLGVAASFALAVAQLEQSSLGPCLFALPLAGALMWLERLRWPGAIYLLAAIAAGFMAAIYVAMIVFSQLHVDICAFCSAEQVRANQARSMGPQQIVGAVAGLVGAVIPFIALTLLGPDLRDRRALKIMGIATAILALLGAIGFSGALPGMTTTLIPIDQPWTRFAQALLFMGPWQIVFGGTLALLLRRHTPKAARETAPA